jgi:hypothetical protein
VLECRLGRRGEDKAHLVIRHQLFQHVKNRYADSQRADMASSDRRVTVLRIRTRLKRLETATWRILPVTDRRGAPGEEDWFELFEAWSKQGHFKREPDTQAALACCCWMDLRQRTLQIPRQNATLKWAFVIRPFCNLPQRRRARKKLPWSLVTGEPWVDPGVLTSSDWFAPAVE